MKRYGNLYERICSYDNLVEAFECAAKKKHKKSYVKKFSFRLEKNLLRIQEKLQTLTFRTSEYKTFKRYEPKERIIFSLPFPDRIVHWAVMLVVEPIWTNYLTRDSYACVKGRGIHPLLKKLKSDLRKYPDDTTYCLKIDVKKFYPSIDHDILKIVIRRRIKDPQLLTLLDGIVDSVPDGSGVPIGNYLSQFFANIYLSELDHQMKELYNVRFYYRYADDIVILSNDKAELHALVVAINHYLVEFRRLSLKGNYQIYPVEARGIDFVGYVTYHTHVLARKANKKKLCRTVAGMRKAGLTDEDIRLQTSSNVGFMKHCNSKHLLKILGIGMKKFSEFKPDSGNFTGDKYHIDMIINRVIHLKRFELSDSKFEKGKKCLTIQYDIYEQLRDSSGNPQTNEDGTPKEGWVEHITFTGSEALAKQLEGVELDEPCEAMIKKQPIGDKGNKFFYTIVDPDS